MPQRYPDPDRGHCWALLDSILLFLSELVGCRPKGFSVSPKSAIRSRPFKLSQGDCRPPCRRHPNVAVSSAAGRPRRWSTQEKMRRHNHRVHSPDLCCRFSQFFILAGGRSYAAEYVGCRERYLEALCVDGDAASEVDVTAVAGSVISETSPRGTSPGRRDNSKANSGELNLPKFAHPPRCNLSGFSLRLGRRSQDDACLSGSPNGPSGSNCREGRLASS
jgi:hypothetical protein